MHPYPSLYLAEKHSLLKKEQQPTYKQKYTYFLPKTDHPQILPVTTAASKSTCPDSLPPHSIQVYFSWSMDAWNWNNLTTPNTSSTK